MAYFDHPTFSAIHSVRYLCTPSAISDLVTFRVLLCMLFIHPTCNLVFLRAMDKRFDKVCDATVETKIFGWSKLNRQRNVSKMESFPTHQRSLEH